MQRILIMSWKAIACVVSCAMRMERWNRLSNILLALAGGSYLSAEIRRSSTFVYAAYLALHTGRLVRAPIDVGILERQLCEWIGEDWKELVDNPDMQQAKARRRGSFFS